jgi:hypothetical protein
VVPKAVISQRGVPALGTLRTLTFVNRPIQVVKKKSGRISICDCGQAALVRGNNTHLHPLHRVAGVTAFPGGASCFANPVAHRADFLRARIRGPDDARRCDAAFRAAILAVSGELTIATAALARKFS